MARRLAGRIVYEGTLVARTPVHVGSGWGDADTDLALAVNGAFEFYLPGTGLAGAMRAWCERVWGTNETSALWGPPGPTDDGFASFVVVDDAVVDPRFAVCELRDGVGIDRVSGAAAVRVKYSRAILPRGSRAGFRLAVDVPAGRDVSLVQARARGLLESLGAGHIRFGAGKTRGLGRLKLLDATELLLQLDARKGMLEALRRKPATRLDLRPQALPDDMLEVEVHWQPDGPLMVKAAADGDVIDALPLTSALDEGLVAPVLPGSSSKGAFRFQAERIVRTVLGRVDVPDSDRPETRFLEQVDDPCLALVRDLFGAAARSEDEVEVDDETEILPGLSALGIDDCFAKDEMKTDAWRAVQTGGGSHPKLEKAVHVAIDRWTGGAADQLLFSVLEPHGIAWEPMRISVDLARIPVSRRHAAVALLVLLLGDLRAGRIPLGYAVNRGMGSVSVESVEVKGGRALGLDATASADLEALRELVRDGWSRWVREAREGGRA